MKFKTITINALQPDDHIEIGEVEAKDQEEAYQDLDLASHNYDNTLLLTEQQFNKLKELINK